MKRRSFILIFVLAAVAASAWGADKALRAAPGFIKARAEKILHEAGYPHASVDRVSLAWGEVALEGIHLDGEGQGVNFLLAQFAISDLLRLRAGNVLVAGGALEGEVSREGKLRLKGRSAGKGGRFALPRLPAARILVADVALGFETPVGRVDAVANGEAPVEGGGLSFSGRAALMHEGGKGALSAKGSMTWDGFLETAVVAQFPSLSLKGVSAVDVSAAGSIEADLNGTWRADVRASANDAHAFGRDFSAISADLRRDMKGYAADVSFHLAKPALDVAAKLDLGRSIHNLAGSAEFSGALAGGADFSLAGDAARMNWQGSADARLHLPFGEVALVADAAQLHFAPFSFSAEKVGLAPPPIKGLSFEDAWFSVAGSAAGASGNYGGRVAGLPLVGSVPATGTWKTDWRTAELSAQVPATAFPNGKTPKMTASASLTLPKTIGKISAKASGGSLTMAGGKFTARDLKASGSFENGLLKADVSSVTLAVPKLGDVSVKGKVSGKSMDVLDVSGSAKTADGRFSGTFAGTAAPMKKAASLSVTDAMANVGKFTLEHGRARVDASWPQVSLADVSAGFSGGHIRLEDVQVDIPGGVYAANAVAGDVDLAAFFAMLGTEGLSGEGRAGARLPLRLAGGKFSVGEGVIENEGPGIIRYRKQVPEADDARLKLAWDVMKNMRYTLMRGDVSGELGGNQSLALKVEGSNPEVYDGRKVEFNLNLSGALDAVFLQGSAAVRVMKGRVAE